MIISGIELRNGLLIFILLGVYFLILDALGLADIVYLRILNGAIVLYGLNRAIRQKIAKGESAYLANFASALSTSLFSVLLSIIGLALYVSVFKESSVSDLATSVIVGNQDVSLVKFCAALIVEGLSSSAILSFILMQYWKNIKGLSSAQKLTN